MSWPQLFVCILIFNISACGTATQSPSQIDTSGWKSYRNETMGFEVMHPDTYHVQSSTGTGPETVSLSETPKIGKPNVSVQFFIQRNINPKGLSIDQWYTDQLKNYKATQPSTTSTIIGARSAIRREAKGTLGIHFSFFTTLNKTDIFQIGITQPSNQAQLDPKYETIISTVKFIN